MPVARGILLDVLDHFGTLLILSIFVHSQLNLLQGIVFPHVLTNLVKRADVVESLFRAQIANRKLSCVLFLLAVPQTAVACLLVLEIPLQEYAV